MRARVAENDERTRLWEALTAKHANYAGYQRKTSRQIPVVVLEPSSRRRRRRQASPIRAGCSLRYSTMSSLRGPG